MYSIVAWVSSQLQPHPHQGVVRVYTNTRRTGGGGQEDRKTGGQEDRKTGGQEDRRTGRQEDRKTGGQEDNMRASHISSPQFGNFTR